MDCGVVGSVVGGSQSRFSGWQLSYSEVVRWRSVCVVNLVLTKEIRRRPPAHGCRALLRRPHRARGLHYASHIWLAYRGAT